MLLHKPGTLIALYPIKAKGPGSRGVPCPLSLVSLSTWHFSPTVNYPLTYGDSHHWLPIKLKVSECASEGWVLSGGLFQAPQNSIPGLACCIEHIMTAGRIPAQGKEILLILVGRHGRPMFANIVGRDGSTGSGNSGVSPDGPAFSQWQQNLWSQRNNYFSSLNQSELKIIVNHWPLWCWKCCIREELPTWNKSLQFHSNSD